VHRLEEKMTSIRNISIIVNMRMVYKLLGNDHGHFIDIDTYDHVYKIMLTWDTIFLKYIVYVG